MIVKFILFMSVCQSVHLSHFSYSSAHIPCHSWFPDIMSILSSYLYVSFDILSIRYSPWLFEIIVATLHLSVTHFHSVTHSPIIHSVKVSLILNTSVSCHKYHRCVRSVSCVKHMSSLHYLLLICSHLSYTF